MPNARNLIMDIVELLNSLSEKDCKITINPSTGEQVLEVVSGEHKGLKITIEEPEN